MLLGESKISYHCFSLTEKDISKLKIPVEESSFSNVDKSIHNVLCKFESFLLTESFFFLQKSTEISSITEVGNDEAVSMLPDDIVTLEYILMLKLGECLDFAI
mgnify:CR=1 FL=1